MGTSEPANASRAAWQKSSYCQGGACVLVEQVDGMVAVADGKSYPGPILYIANSDWNVFLARIKQGGS
jgi:Domain of unknown function (DUF397)